MVSSTTEEYLRTIYVLQEDNNPVAPSAIADTLDVTAPTVTKMMKKFHEQGLVANQQYEGVRLTEEGEHIALTVVRRHRLLKSLLIEIFDYDWTEIHDEADRLEHHISEYFTDQLADVLGNPTRDPHGRPIPNADLTMPADGDSSLCEFEEGETVVVTQVISRDKDVLGYLNTIGIIPETRLEITTNTSFGMLSVQPVDDYEEHVLSEELATVVRANQ